MYIVDSKILFINFSIYLLLQEMDEFFDALSASVTDYMAQSFFSTASTAFAEASSRPPSPLSEASSPLQDFFGSNDQGFPSVSCQLVTSLLLVKLSSLPLTF